jgi:hypothetical protein
MVYICIYIWYLGLIGVEEDAETFESDKDAETVETIESDKDAETVETVESVENELEGGAGSMRRWGANVQ